MTLTKSTCGTTTTSAVTVTVTAKGATTTTRSISQGANSYSDSGGLTTYGAITGTGNTGQYIPASGGSGSVTFDYATQSYSTSARIRTYASGSTSTLANATSGSVTIKPTPDRIDASANSKGTIVSDYTNISCATAV